MRTRGVIKNRMKGKWGWEKGVKETGTLKKTSVEYKRV